MRSGAQFYTIREFCKTPEALAESMRKVADIGYTKIQLSGVCAYDAQWMKEQLAATGLECVVTHVAIPKLREQLDEVCADHKVFGCSNVGLGMFDFRKMDPEEAYPQFLELCKPVAQKLKENGLYFMYHNHDGEFKNYRGQTILRQIAQDFPADELGVIVDTYWVQKGGANPAEYIRELAGRVPCIHVKDYAYGAEMAVVGEGNINFEAVIAAAEDAGTQYLLVEQDKCNGEDPFACLKRSYQNLRALGLE